MAKEKFRNFDLSHEIYMGNKLFQKRNLYGRKYFKEEKSFSYIRVSNE